MERMRDGQNNIGTNELCNEANHFYSFILWDIHFIFHHK